MTISGPTMTEPTRRTFRSTCVADTLGLGRAIGRAVRPGDVLALVGPLGAGKTHLVKGVAEGLGIADSRHVISPTFVLIREYEGRLWLYHFDAYRLSDPGEMYELGCEEYFEGTGVCVVEWADRVRECLPPDYVEVRIEVLGEHTRAIELVGIGRRPAGMVRAVDAAHAASPDRGSRRQTETNR